ncbi:MAG: gamma-glutamyltranspeptidase / glutathione hydrolase, partial [Acidimicrobiaceae bacterium]|nr:gamma-glutamyltranspeptidase / glutathione hydrolase [Acidimicrobiaceae bacterium]
MAGPRVPMPTVCAPTAMVASADALATRAGLDIMARGGSAVDGAIATNAVLADTAPHLCGMGGDLFALVHDGSATPAVLNASGRAGAGADSDRLRSEGHRTMPFQHDIRTVTVPGCVDGWLALHERYGRVALTDVLGAAIGYAEGGFPASPLLAATVGRLDGARPPDYVSLRAAGDVVRRPGAGRTLRAIATAGRAAFYGGEFGAGLLALGGGYFAPADLERSQADWVAPLAVDAFGHRLWTVPPNAQGYITLAAAWIADGLALPSDPDDDLWVHLLAEAAVQAGFDRPTVLSETADGGALVAPERLLPRRAAIRGESISNRWVRAATGDTTYLCVVDGDGMGVSLIQSNAAGFGSHIFEPATGINLHNRGLGFSLEPGHPAEYGPGRRPPHTLCPALVTDRDGTLRAVLGTQGGDGQPIVLLQVLARLLQAGQTPAEAIGSSRFVFLGSGQGFDAWTNPGGP